jgi:hypothetical protein
MIVLVLDEGLDPAFIADFLTEAGFKVVNDPSAAIALFDQRTSEAGVASIASDIVAPAKAEHDLDDGQMLGPPGALRLRSACAWPG